MSELIVAVASRPSGPQWRFRAAQAGARSCLISGEPVLQIRPQPIVVEFWHWSTPSSSVAGRSVAPGPATAGRVAPAAAPNAYWRRF